MKNKKTSEINETEIKNSLGHIKTPESWKETAINHTQSEYEPVPYVRNSFRRTAAAVCSVIIVLGVIVSGYTIISRSMLKNSPAGEDIFAEPAEKESDPSEMENIPSVTEYEDTAQQSEEIPETEEPGADTVGDRYEEYVWENILFGSNLYFVTPERTICRRPGHNDEYYPADRRYVTELYLPDPDEWSVYYDHDGAEFGMRGHVFSDNSGHRFIVSDLIYYPDRVDFDEVFAENVLIRLAASPVDNGTVIIAAELNADADQRTEIEKILGECTPFTINSSYYSDFDHVKNSSRYAAAYLYAKYLEAQEAFYSFYVHAGSMYGFDASSDIKSEPEIVHDPKVDEWNLPAEMIVPEILPESEYIVSGDDAPHDLSYSVTLKNGAISSYTELEAYLETLFTRTTVDMLLGEGIYSGDDSNLFAKMGDRGTDISYGNVTGYKAVMTDEDTVVFSICVEHGDLWEENPVIEYECFDYTYSRTPYGWRWSDFYIYN